MARSGSNEDNVRISGEGRVAGGSYGAVTINGAGSIKGDIACSTFRVNGTATTDASVKADTAVVNGTASFGGEVQAGEMTVNGDASVTNGLGVGQLKVKGRLYVGGGIAAHDVDSKGELTVGGDCEADTFRAEGAFSVGGLLNAGTVDVRLYASSKVREIGGERVTVRQATGFATLFAIFSEKRLTAESIEADDVVLEFVTAKTVRGARVSIGEGCDIDLVEYTDRFDRSAGAVVRNANKVAATPEA